MIEAEWWEYDSLDELADAVAGDVGFIIESAVDARDASLIAVPGGKTGPAIFRKLAAQKLPWKKVTIIPTDDRLVAVDSELSNVRELARAFLPLGARVVPLTSEAAGDYKLAGNAADARLQDLPWPPDLVWLGMGADGHVASIFPGADLQAALDAPEGAAGDRHDARAAAGGGASRARDSDPRRDPVGADRADHDHRTAEARCARAGDRGRA